MVAMDPTMDARIKVKGIDIGIERLEKIGSDTAALTFVKSEPVEEIGFRPADDSKPHASFATLRRSRVLASSQSLNFAVPASTARSASRSASACHFGESNLSSS